MRNTDSTAAAAAVALFLTVATAVLIDERIDPHSGLVRVETTESAAPAAPTETRVPSPHADPAPIDETVAVDICAALDTGTPAADLIAIDLPVDTAEQAAQLLDDSIEKHCPQYLTDYRAVTAPKE